MDRNFWTARTDIIVIVIVNEKDKTLTWLPRDVYSEIIKDRINVAYRKGGGNLLVKCLQHVDYAVTYCICLLPCFIDDIIEKITHIDVPLYYPFHRYKPI